MCSVVTPCSCARKERVHRTDANVASARSEALAPHPDDERLKIRSRCEVINVLGGEGLSESSEVLLVSADRLEAPVADVTTFFEELCSEGGKGRSNTDRGFHD